LSAATQLRTSVGTVFGNPGLRRVQLAFFGSGLGDWAYATAVTVYAFQHGGATAVGAFQAVRFIASAIAAPLGAAIADRVSRRSFMMASDAVRAVLVAAAALCVALDVAPAAVYVLAVLAVIVGAPFRSAQAGLVPALARTPDELTASNAVASNLENIVIFAGPAIGAALVGAFNVQTAFWLNVVSYVWSFVLVAGVHVSQPSRVGVTDADDPDAPDESDDDGGFFREAAGGFVVIARDPDLRVTALLAATQGFLFGALMVLNVLISVRMLHAGASGVGYLVAISGVGMVVGGIVVLARVGRHSVAGDMAIGVLGWGTPFLLLAVAPSLPTALLALLIVGFMDPWVNLGLDTLPQRLAPERLISRAFAAVDASLIAAMSVGSLVAPLLLDLVGLRGTLVILGGASVAYAASVLPHMRRLDGRLHAPPETELLAGIPIFAPLAPPALEALANALERRTVPVGEVIVAEGDVSDAFYVIASGEVSVSQGGRELRREGTGEVFGEIGLLRDVPRTATVTAVTDTELLLLHRVVFLQTVTGTTESMRAAEDLASRRLAV
jgi:MFS family permease